MRRKTGRVTKAKTKTSKKSENAKSKIHEKKREMIIHKLQEAESYNDTCNSNNFNYIPQTRSNVQTSPKRDSSFIQSNANNRNEDIVYKYYRCEHFLEMSSNLSRPFCKRTSTVIGQCEVDLNFIQGIIWLKSAIAHTSQIPIDKLRHNIFTKRWNTRDKCNYSEKRRTDDVEQLGPSVSENLPIYKETATENTSVSPNLLNLSDISDISCNASPRVIYGLHIKSENSQDESLIGNLNTSPVEFLTQERYTGCQMGSVRSKKLSSAFDIPPETNFKAESFKSQRDMFDDEPEHRNKCIENIFFSQKRYADDQDEYKSSPDTSRFIESLNNYNFTSISSHHNLTCADIDSQCDYDPADQILTQLSQVTISRIDDAMHWKQKNANNSQADQMQLLFSNGRNDDDGDFKTDVRFQIDDNDIDTRIENNDTTIKNVKHDSAYSTSHIHTFNNTTLKSLDDNQRMLGTNTERHYELRNRKKKHEEIISSSSAIGSRKTSNINNKRSPLKGQPSSKKHKSEARAKNLSKEIEESKEEMISANWLNFTLDSLNSEQVILESFKVILSTLCDERTAEEYATHGCWKGTLEEEAVNAVLILSDIFRMEKKPNIFRKEIVTAINKTLDEMLTCVQLNKTFVFRSYCVRIILELCNSLSVCVAVIDHLTAKLKPLQSTLSEAMRSQQTNQLNLSITINRLYLIFYALNIALRKYRTVIPSSRRARSAEDVIPHAADLWKARYIDEELEDAGLNVDAAEKQWINALENFKNFVPFAEKAISLLRILLL